MSNEEALDRLRSYAAQLRLVADLMEALLKTGDVQAASRIESEGGRIEAAVQALLAEMAP